MYLHILKLEVSSNSMNVIEKKMPLNFPEIISGYLSESKLCQKLAVLNFLHILAEYQYDCMTFKTIAKNPSSHNGDEFRRHGGPLRK